MTLTDRQRLDCIEQRNERIERAIAQIVTGMDLGFGWRPEANFQPELQAIRDEQLQAIAQRKREAVSA